MRLLYLKTVPFPVRNTRQCNTTNLQYIVNRITTISSLPSIGLRTANWRCIRTPAGGNLLLPAGCNRGCTHPQGQTLGEGSDLSCSKSIPLPKSPWFARNSWTLLDYCIVQTYPCPQWMRINMTQKISGSRR